MTDILLLMKHELTLVVIIVLLLILKIREKEEGAENYMPFVNIMLAGNFLLGLVLNRGGELFDGMFVSDNIMVLQKNILNFGVLMISMQSSAWLGRHRHAPEFFVLLLSTLLGMFLLLSSRNFLMFYLALELSTIPLAAMCNYDLAKRRSSEAAMKLILSSALSSGILLFGISLFYGATGTFDFREISSLADSSALQIMAFIMVFTGFAFKLSVVPFHLWTADVYEGSPVAVTSFLSVISKGVMVFALCNVLYTVFNQMSSIWYDLIVITSVLTMAIGNLFAIRQENIKRFLAFSSIAQVSYILIGISGMSAHGMTSSIYFILIYIFSNLGAFGVVAIVSHASGKESINDYRGFAHKNPALAWILTISLFSLAGIPPTAGFFGKLFLLNSGAGQENWYLIIFASMNMIVSLYYYLRVVKSMFMDETEEEINVESTWLARLSLYICVGGILITGFTTGIYEHILSLAQSLK
ncbi:MAG: NADH-quinone oxidoreductase subunit N [Bacteroidetes bacterium]|nr:MAG: NADH-quinone oxidoreductase subunit N [Bacteroidota bacterium]REK06485.1 MAG: NADH-quinone oxidoreductase subunit N [Bacteroidota bacterium]REK47088.1 MAG: NADH-quinone oxidoreductase subunit N [Bacteroidota bacterium]